MNEQVFSASLLIALALLSVYLCVSVGLRLRSEAARQRTGETQPPGTAFDVSAIAPQIQKLREDHLAAMRSRPHRSHYRAKLVAAARQVVTALAYFHRSGSEDEMHKHGA